MGYGSEVEKLERRWMENPMGVSFAPLAEAYRRAGEQPRALEVLAIGLANHAAYVPALIVQARCHLDVQADGAAEASFLAVLATDAHNLIALKGLADICERSGRPEEALRHLDRLLEADPTHDDGRAQMDRVSGMIAEREHLRGDGGGSPRAEEAPATTAPSHEPIGFEPTAAGALEDPAALEDIALGLDPASDAPHDEDSGGTAFLGAGEPLLGLEVVEPELPVEAETSPVELAAPADDESPVAVGPSEDEPLLVPFEEELPGAWLDQSHPEAVEDGTVDEEDPAGREAGAGADPGSGVGLDLDEDHPPEPAAAPVPHATEAFWTPTGASWRPEEPAETAVAEEASLPTPARDPEENMEETSPELSSDPVSGMEPGQGRVEATAGLDPEPEMLAPPSGAGPSEDEVSFQAEVEPVGVVAEDGPPEPEESLPGVEAPAVEVEPDFSWGIAAAESPEPEVERVEATESQQQSEMTETYSLPATDSAERNSPEDDGPLVVEGAESELPIDAEPEIEPALVMTATMARVFEKQGHQTMALAIYAQLAEQDPGNAALAESVARLSRALESRVTTGPRAPVEIILGRTAASSAPDPEGAKAEPESGLRLDGPATRASGDLFSLSAVFGSSRPVVESAVFTPGVESAPQEPSFDEFFDGGATTEAGTAPAGGAGEEDLEQFTAWLRSLKR